LKTIFHLLLPLVAVAALLPDWCAAAQASQPPPAVGETRLGLPDDGAETAPAAPVSSPETRALVAGLGRLTAAPQWKADPGESGEGLRAIFFDSVPWQGRPTKVFAWLGLPKNREGPVRKVIFESDRSLDDCAVLVHTADHGFTGDRQWTESPAMLLPGGDGQYAVVAEIPEGSTAWFFNVTGDGLTVSVGFESLIKSEKG